MTHEIHPIDSSEHRNRSRAEIADQTMHPCDLCGAPISNLSCYGWWRYNEPEDSEEPEADLVHACWRCRVEAKRGEREEV